MNWKRISRTIICLLVVCALTLNISPIGVMATGVEVVISYVGAAMVLFAILVGLGVTVNNELTLPTGESFMSALTDYVSANYSGFTEDERIAVYSLNPDMPYVVDSALVELVRDWLFDNNILAVSQAQTLGSGFTIDTVKTTGLNFWKSISLYDAFAGISSGFLLMCCTNSTMTSKGSWGGICVDSTSYSVPVLRLGATSSIAPFTSDSYPLSTIVDGLTMERLGDNFFCRNYDDAASVYSSTGQLVYYLTPDTVVSSFIDGSVTSGQNVYLSFLNMGCIAANGQLATVSVNMYVWKSSGYTYTYPLSPNYTSSDVVTSDLDITLGAVALPGVSLAQGYATWAGNSITVPGDIADTDEDVVGLPIVWGDTLTQEEVWYGELNVALDNTFPSDSVSRTPLQTFLNALTAFIVTPLLDGIKAIFVPSEDFLSEKFNSIRSTFQFAGAIIEIGSTISDRFSDYGHEPPVIYIDLGASRGDYYFGGKVAFIDMHWYEEYKSSVDSILSSFLWLYFVWKVFLKLPGIISGMPGDFVMDALDGYGISKYLPSRSMDNAVTRHNLSASVRQQHDSL